MGPGDLVGASVRLERLLGAGGMGSVWVADHLALHTQVAVKFMSPEMAKSPEGIARFEREATAAAQIKSPHVVQVFDHGLTADGAPFIVMELLQGEDLGARLSRGPLALGETLHLTRQLCRALSRAQQVGIVHRDIKPANVFLVDVEGDLFVKVLDFGIAKRVKDDGTASDMTQAGMVMGTPRFMSPEQFRSTKDVDFRCDLWAVAVLAYLCLTGEVPFIGDSVGAVAVAVTSGTFVPVTTLAPTLPSGVDDWFARAFARKPEDRFDSAIAMGDALRDVVPREMRTMRPPAAPSSGVDSAPEDTAPLATSLQDPAPCGERVPTSTKSGIREPPAASARSEEVLRAAALRTAAYGPAPSEWWVAPFYAYRVKRRQVDLRRKLAARTAAHAEAEVATDRARATFGERAWPLISRSERYVELARAVTAAEATLHERDGTLAAETEELGRKTASIDDYRSQLAAAAADAAALAKVHADADASERRAAARLQRTMIELRNAVTSPGDAGPPDAEAAARTAERNARQAELEQAKQETEKAERALAAAQRTLAALEGMVRDAKNEQAAIEDHLRHRAPLKSAEVAAAQTALTTALTALGRAAVADRASLGAEFDPLREEIAALERAAAVRNDEVMLYVRALDMHDARMVRTGGVVGLAILALLLAVAIAPVLLLWRATTPLSSSSRTRPPASLQ